MLNQPTKQENRENLKFLRRHFADNRVPVSGSINLTNRCNLNCVHCFLGDRNSPLRHSKNELSTEQWLSIIKQITEAGCINLLFSGGEVLLRPDFDVIYEKAVTSGILVTIFTNGTLLNRNLYSLFIDLPPQSIEISLYGATPQTYESITGEKGSFERCINGIQGLHDNRIRFELKTMILTQNLTELDGIQRIARDFGVNFRMDAAVTPCLDGDRQPLKSRVDSVDAVKADFGNLEMSQKWLDYFKKLGISRAEDFLYNCGAGLTHFHINPDGIMLPCMMLNSPAYDLKNGNFMDGWHYDIAEIRKIKAGSSYKCNTCDKRLLCSGCPAFFDLENGSPELHSHYLCEIADYRLKAINKRLRVEESRIK